MRHLALVTLLLACSSKGAPTTAPPDELPARSTTIWAERTELFAEYAPLIVGAESRFAAHVTALPSFAAVTSGSATMTVAYADGTRETAQATTPSSPGIFRVVITPRKPGPCKLTFAVASAQTTETFDAGACAVFSDEAAARAALAAEPASPDRIAFRKEQQWKTEFAVVAATSRDLQDGVRASGEIRPVAGREAKVAAPVAGRIELSAPIPLLGMPVGKNAILGRIAPRTSGGDRATFSADVTALQAEVAAARTELARVERLVADQAAPARAVDEARTRLRVAEARLGGAAGRLAQFDASASGGGGGRRFDVRSPIDGTLVAIDVATGENVEEGALLFDVVDLARVWLVANVFEPDVPRVESARTAWFTIDGYSTPFTVDETTGKLVTIGRVVDPRTRTVPVIFEVDNRDGRLRIGNFTKITIATGAARNVLAVPESALVDDAGKAVVYVMASGEAFERRPVRLGVRSNGWVEVVDGIVAGEHVVTKGAYEIRLAAASGSVPAHGHAH